jgi:hypothetical protein
MLSSSESVGSTYSTSKGKERQSDEDFDHTVSNQKVGSSEAYSMTTGRSYSESTVGSQENRHTVQGDSLNYETVNGRSYSETTHGSSETHNIIQDASASFDTFEGGRYTEQTVLGNSTSLTTVAGVDLSTSVIESSIRSNTVGISDDTSLTVMSSSTADVGETIDMRSTGISTTVHSTDDAFDLSFYGVVTRGEFSDVSITLKLEPDGLVAEIKGETVELPEMKIIL